MESRNGVRSQHSTIAKRRVLGEAAGGLDDAGVSAAVKRFERRRANGGKLSGLLAQSKAELLNVET